MFIGTQAGVTFTHPHGRTHWSYESEDAEAFMIPGCTGGGDARPRRSATSCGSDGTSEAAFSFFIYVVVVVVFFVSSF